MSMSREIKFRAWDKKTNSWYDDSNQHLVINLDGTLTNCWNGELMEDYTERIILLPFTGLKDKNGVEIYEGDIVQIKDHSFQREPDGYTGIEIDGFYPVTYTESMELVAGQWLLMHQLPYVTVIGNIYENPELLEVES